MPQAVAAMHKLQTMRDTVGLPETRMTPKFSDFADKYVKSLVDTPDTKRASTVNKERLCLRLWKKHFGDIRLSQITKPRIREFMASRQQSGVSGRTVNLDIICLRNLLRRAIEDGWLRALPTENIRPLKWVAKKRSLFELSEITKVATAGYKSAFTESRLASAGEAGLPLRNAQQLEDYLLLMAYSGARRNEALRLKWSDVDWGNRQLTIGSDGSAKNRESRVVDFTGPLEALLKSMHSRRAPDTGYLFPSPQRGASDTPAKSLYDSFKLARRAVSSALNFHDLRHFFISSCVMSNIDFMTIARWVGHKDGGVLIGKVYGHLADQHRKQMANKVSFTVATRAADQVAARRVA